MRIGMAPGVMEARFASLMRWATPESFAVFSACITVSGHATIPAALLMRDGRAVGVVTHASSVAAFAWAVRPRMLRCHDLNCRRWEVPTKPNMELGWSGYCTRCIYKLKVLCLKRHGRLPKVRLDKEGRLLSMSEFLCPYCLELRRHPDDRCSPDWGERLRVKCIQCRRADWRRTWRRRAEREAAGG